MALWFFKKVVWFVLATMWEGILLPSNMVAKSNFCFCLVKRLIVMLKCAVYVTTSSFQQFPLSLSAKFLFGNSLLFCLRWPTYRFLNVKTAVYQTTNISVEISVECQWTYYHLNQQSTEVSAECRWSVNRLTINRLILGIDCKSSKADNRPPIDWHSINSQPTLGQYVDRESTNILVNTPSD